MLPVDVGKMGVTKDAGRCALDLARSTGWFDNQAISHVQLQINTFNGNVRRCGLASIEMQFDVGGLGSVIVRPLPASAMQSWPYRG